MRPTESRSRAADTASCTLCALCTLLFVADALDRSATHGGERPPSSALLGDASRW
jgi:hypothetical protein